MQTLSWTSDDKMLMTSLIITAIVNEIILLYILYSY